jgi:hypothetical protein
MPHGFETYRVFISAPGDLERDREACHDAIAEANQTTAMPANVLLVEVGLRDNEQMSGHRAIVSDNVRWSTYFIQLFEDDWGPRDLFRKLFLLATECRDDPAMPMRDIAICMKDAPGETNPEILAFRRELEEFPNIRIFRYSAPDALKEHLRTICEGWSRDAIELARIALANSVSPATG